MHRIIKVVCVSIFLGISTHAAEPAQVVRGEILDFGMYRIIKPAQDIPVGDGSGHFSPIHISPEIEFLTHTNYINAKKGIAFGFTYKLTNLPTNRPISLAVEAIHPGILKPDGKMDYGRKIPIEIVTPNGEFTNHYGYRIDEDDELLEGTWTLSIYSGADKLVSKRFQIKK
jgi:hypothetical protein